MKTKILLLISFLSLILVSCNEFSKCEEDIIKNGRLRDEAIASEFYDTFAEYWINTISEEVGEIQSNILDQLLEELLNSYLYANKYEKRIEKFENLYFKTIDLLKSQIGENGLAATANSLNTILKYIEEGNPEWMYGDEESFPVKLAYIIAQSEKGLVPNGSLKKKSYNFNNTVWSVYYTNDVYSGSNDNCIYIVLKLVQNWIMNEQQEDISVVYCVPYGDSFNSYLVGYSNHRSFLITFLRNHKEICKYEWQEMEYETSFVGASILD